MPKSQHPPPSPFQTKRKQLKVWFETRKREAYWMLNYLSKVSNYFKTPNHRADFLFGRNYWLLGELSQKVDSTLFTPLALGEHCGKREIAYIPQSAVRHISSVKKNVALIFRPVWDGTIKINH